MKSGTVSHCVLHHLWIILDQIIESKSSWASRSSYQAIKNKIEDDVKWHHEDTISQLQNKKNLAGKMSWIPEEINSMKKWRGGGGGVRNQETSVRWQTNAMCEPCLDPNSNKIIVKGHFGD